MTCDRSIGTTPEEREVMLELIKNLLQRSQAGDQIIPMRIEFLDGLAPVIYRAGLTEVMAYLNYHNSTRGYDAFWPIAEVFCPYSLGGSILQKDVRKIEHEVLNYISAHADDQQRLILRNVVITVPEWEFIKAGRQIDLPIAAD